MKKSKNVIRYAMGIFYLLGLTGCLSASFLAPSIETLPEGAQPMRGGLPLPGDQVYKKSRFTFNPPQNNRGWMLVGYDDYRVSIFSPRSRTWISGGYLSLDSGVTFSDKNTLLKEFKEAEVAYLNGKESATLTTPLLHEEFENISGEMDFEPRDVNGQTFFVSQYSAELWMGEIQVPQKIFLYLLPDEDFSGIYAVAMVTTEDSAQKGQLPMKSFLEVVNNFIVKK